MSSNKSLRDVKYSALDLAYVSSGEEYHETFRKLRELARRLEGLGYERLWISEHHNMEAVASSATSIVIGNVAENTKSMRVGAGGIMLPNHSPLIIAEQFGTLGTLYPDRIDLGLGRAAGTDGATARALRGNNYTLDYDFRGNILALQRYMSTDNSRSRVRAFPAEGVKAPIYILGSSIDSASLAGSMGLPYVFAAHFAPAQLYYALSLYHESFKPSIYLSKPYTIVCVNVIAANSNSVAEHLATSLYLAFSNRHGSRLMPPVDNISAVIGADVLAATRQILKQSFIGDRDILRKELKDFIERTQVDEVMAITHIYNQADKLASFEIFASIFV